MLVCVFSDNDVLKGRPHLLCTGIGGAVAPDCSAKFWCSSSLRCPRVLADCCFLFCISVGSDNYNFWIILTGPFREDKMPRKKMEFIYTILWFSYQNYLSIAASVWRTLVTLEGLPFGRKICFNTTNSVPVICKNN